MNDVPSPTADTAPTDEPITAAAPPSHPDHGEHAVADLDRIEHDLAGVEAALERLDAGTYWTDEATGAPIPDDVLAADPVARRAG